jgi:hypothetical protein
MEEHCAWMTARQIRPGTLADFERAWRPDTHPGGMLRACAYWSEDEREIVGISLWAPGRRVTRGGPRARKPAAGGDVCLRPWGAKAFYRGRELVVPSPWGIRRIRPAWGKAALLTRPDRDFHDPYPSCWLRRWQTGLALGCPTKEA